MVYIYIHRYYAAGRGYETHVCSGRRRCHSGAELTMRCTCMAMAWSKIWRRLYTSTPSQQKHTTGDCRVMARLVIKAVTYHDALYLPRDPHEWRVVCPQIWLNPHSRYIPGLSAVVDLGLHRREVYKDHTRSWYAHLSRARGFHP